MSTAPRVGVVITNCDTWSLTLRCLERLAPFRAALSDVVVVDDASVVPGPEVLPRGVRLLRNPERQGYGRALDRGIRDLDADVAVIFDSDAYPMMDFTGEVRDLFSDPRLAIAGFQTFDGEGSPTGSHDAEPGVACLVLGQRLNALWSRFVRRGRDPVCIFSCAMALDKGAFAALNGFDQGFDFLDLDTDLSMRAHRAGWKVLHAPALTAFHVGSGSPQRTSKRVLRFYRNRWRLLRKFDKVRHPGLVRALILGRLGIELLALRLAGPLLVRDSEALRDKLAGRREVLEHVRREFR
ncbi:MAG TPA: glycosyltransferase [Thermoanaerobaculia bacterium]|nr:glycosyltransferase [Thermoanaerobaculia bacterium]